MPSAGAPPDAGVMDPNEIQPSEGEAALAAYEAQQFPQVAAPATVGVPAPAPPPAVAPVPFGSTPAQRDPLGVLTARSPSKALPAIPFGSTPAQRDPLSVRPNLWADSEAAAKRAEDEEKAIQRAGKTLETATAPSAPHGARIVWQNPILPAPAASTFGSGGNVDLVDPKEQAALHRTYTDQERSIDDAITAQFAGAGAKAQAESHVADALEKRKVDILNRIDDRKGNLRDELAKLSALSDEAAKAGVDPERWDRTRTPGQKLAMTLAAAFSGFAAGWNHQGGNAALESQERERAADIDSQKEAINAKRNQVGDYRARLAELTRENEADELRYDAADVAALQAQERRGEAAQIPASAEERAAALRGQIAGVAREDVEKDIAEHKYVRPGSVGAYTPDRKWIRDQALAMVSQGAKEGRVIDPDAAVAQASRLDKAANGIHQGGAALDFSAKPKPGQADTGPVDLGPSPGTTQIPSPMGAGGLPIGNPLAGAQFSSDHPAYLEQKAFNARLTAAAHKYAGARSPEAQEHIIGALMIKPGDSKEEIDRKADVAKNLINGWRKQQSGKDDAGASEESDLDTELGK